VNRDNRSLRGGTIAFGLAGLASVASGACAHGGGDGFGLGPTVAKEDAGAAPNFLQPTFGTTQTSSVSPPALSGGTLLVTKSGSYAVAADPDRDAIYVVDLSKNSSKIVTLQAGDEPGRLAEDGSGHVHVALRRGGALVTVDPTSASIITRRSVCPAPRGLAWESATDLVWVACATGELVGMPASGGSATQSFVVERDLRDVLVTSSGLAVSQFRSAQVLRVDATGTISRRDNLPAPSPAFVPHVAWRTVASPSGVIYAVHQEETVNSLDTGMLAGEDSGAFAGSSSSGSGGGFSGGGGFISAPIGPLGSGLPSGGGYGVSAGCGGGGGGTGTVFFGGSSSGGPIFPPPSDDGGLFGGSSSGATGVASSSGFVGDDSGLAVGEDASEDAMAVTFDGGVEGSISLPPTMLPPPPPPEDAGGTTDAGLQCNVFGLGLPLNLQLGPLGNSGQTISSQCAMSGAVHSVLTAIDEQGSLVTNVALPGVLPVDMAISPDGQNLAVALPGDAYLDNLPTVLLLSPCGTLAQSSFTVGGEGNKAQPVGVAYGPTGTLFVQTRDPAQLWFVDPSGSRSSITLSSVSRHDTGYDVFHTQAGGMIACASCHPEGRDDGHVWRLDGNTRRTPSLAGTIAGTAPYHWPGDMKDMNALVDNVYTVRMSGAQLASDQMKALTNWVQGRPAPSAPSWIDTAAAAHGKVLFDSATVGCSGCHSGAKFTDNTDRDVGSGGRFQVPPLVGVGWRTPLLHDGCAKTVADRFSTCDSPTHGNTRSLSTGDLTDLEMYLESL
jgi:hypothetical protein